MNILLPRDHPLLQHFVVGAGSEMFRYLKTILKTNDQSHFFTAPAQLIFATKFTYNGTCQLTTNSFHSSHFVSMRFTQYSKALI